MSKKLCPVCLKEKTQFEAHHVVWRAEGGSGDPVNLLDICKSDHALITRGDDEDRIPRDLACFAHQMGKYGLTFLLKSNALFDKESAFGQPFVEKYGTESAEEVDRLLKHIGKEMYYKYLCDAGVLPSNA
jgi:hypothetical protein